MVGYRDLAEEVANLAVGSVAKLYYFNVLRKKRKIFIFTGICTAYNKKTGTFNLRNTLSGGVSAEINFSLSSPHIIELQILVGYNFQRFRRRRALELERPRVGFFKGNRRLVTNPKLSLDPYDYLYSPVVAFSERQRLRRKFRI
jgi:ribosomal protein L19